MRAFSYLLRLAYRVLTARRFVLFLPNHPNMILAVRGNIEPATWEAIVHFSMREHLAALAAEQAKVAALEAEILHILRS